MSYYLSAYFRLKLSSAYQFFYQNEYDLSQTGHILDIEH